MGGEQRLGVVHESLGEWISRMKTVLRKLRDGRGSMTASAIASFMTIPMGPQPGGFFRLAPVGGWEFLAASLTPVVWHPTPVATAPRCRSANGVVWTVAPLSDRRDVLGCERRSL